MYNKTIELQWYQLFDELLYIFAIKQAAITRM